MRYYTNPMNHKGFTIVELIVVIVVIVILTTITIASYTFMREDAMDAKIYSTAKTVGEALALAESHGEGMPDEGVFEGPPGATNAVDNKLIPNYLKPGYRDGITSKRANSSNTVFLWYYCGGSGKGIVVYAAINNPTSADLANVEAIRTRCGQSSSVIPTLGSGSVYGHAEVF